MYSEIVREPQFYLDKEKHYFPEATAFIMTGKHLDYLYVLLHSLPVTFFFKKFYAGGGLGESGYRYKKAFLENLPIPQFNGSPLQKEIAKFSESKPAFNDANLTKLITHLYGLNTEESAFVERQ